MSERSLVDYILRSMRGKWRKPVKHADAFTAGVADLSAFMEPVGTVWIECKVLDKWPARPRTKVRFGFDALQRDFLMERRGWLFVRVKRNYLLFDHNGAKFVEGATRSKIESLVIKDWYLRVDWAQFAALIKKRRPNL